MYVGQEEFTMKNYELIAELMKLPAGYEIEFYKAEENGKPAVIEDITDFEIDEANETITLLCE